MIWISICCHSRLKVILSWFQADAIAVLLDVNMEVACPLDYQGNMSLDYARDYSVGGLVGMIRGLCNYRYAAREYIEQVED